MAAILSIVTLSGCGGAEFPNELKKLDYDKVYTLGDYEGYLIGEKPVGDYMERYRLTYEGEELGKLTDFREYDGKEFYYNFLENERFELVDETGKVWGEYATPPLEDVKEYVYCMPKPEALLSDNDIVVCGERYEYHYYNKNTGEIVFSPVGMELREPENGIGVVVYDPSGTRDISDLESKMNGQSAYDYVLLDKKEVYMPQKNGTFGAGCDYEFWGESYTADGLLEAPYTEDGILPYLIMVRRHRIKGGISDVPEYMFMDLKGNPICQQTFRRTSGFKEGIAFCERINDPMLWIMTKDGEFFKTGISIETLTEYESLWTRLEITYYPEYDLFGLECLSGTKDKIIVDRRGNVVASEEKNNINLIKYMIEAGVEKDSEVYKAALKAPEGYNDDDNLVVTVSKEGFIVTDESGTAMCVFSYSTNEYTVYEREDTIGHQYAKIRDFESKYAYTDFGMIDMTTGEVVDESPDIIVYDEEADRKYISTDKGFGYYGEDGKLVEFKCDDYIYLGNGNFLVEKKGKEYITNMF